MIRTILLTLSLFVTCSAQTIQHETSLLIVKDGKAVIKAVSLDHKSLPDRWHLKPEQYLVTKSFGVTVEIKEINEIDVYVAPGFTLAEKQAMEMACIAWNASETVEFVWKGEGSGKVTIQRQKSKDGRQAYTEIKTLDGVLVSAEIFVNSNVTDARAVQSTIAHELGHVVGLADCRDCDSVMKFKSKGKNRDNGHAGPTKVDLTALGVRP